MSLNPLRRRSRAWGRRQLYSFFSSLGTLWSHRGGTLMTVWVLGIAMALPLGLYVSLDNLRALDLQQDRWGAITVFLHSDSGEEQAVSLARIIEQEFSAEVREISPGQGLDDFRQASGFGPDIEDLFEENPLPWALLVLPEPANERELGERVAVLDSWLHKRPEVDLVQVDFKWLQRLAGLLELGNALVTVLTVMFALAVIVIVANTIRLDVANRSEEIHVLSLVGASNGFIRQPFLYSGFWYGLLGGLLALVLLNLSLYYLGQPLERLMDAYGNAFNIQNLSLKEGVLTVFSGGLLGFLGAWVSVQRYLRQITQSGTLGRH